MMGLFRYKQVSWERGRWCVEEIYMGREEGGDRSGGRRGGEHSAMGVR